MEIRKKNKYSFRYKTRRSNLEFKALQEGVVKVSGFMRKGQWVKGFKRKDLLAKAQEVAEDAIGEAGVVTRNTAQKLVKTGELPSRGEAAKLTGNYLLGAIKNPKKAIEQGLKREKLVMEGLSLQLGRDITKKEVIQAGLGEATENFKKLVQDPEQKKELIINLNGFFASKAGQATGIPGVGLAGDLVGAKITRRSFDDWEVLNETLSNLRGTEKFDSANRLDKVTQIFSESKRLVESQKSKRMGNTIGDVSGWAAGNFGGEALKSVPGISSIPLAGALPGMITAGLSQSVYERVPPQTFKEAAYHVLTDRIKKGNYKEEKLRKKVKDNWNLIKTFAS